MYLTTIILSFSTSIVFVLLIRRLGKRLGLNAQPRPDRWHTEPTPYFGGVGIFLGFLIAVLFTVEFELLPWGIILAAGFSFAIGLIDDIWHISPQTKLVGLFISAFVVIIYGNVTAFFPWRFANILISFLWLVSIANALNLLDNMDGLAGGTAVITAGFLAYFFWKYGNVPLLEMTLAIVGSVIGFWIFNFPPASIFMGDSGSLFLGMTLAALAIAREPQASNVFAVMGIPVFIFLLPIIDTVMVSLTRILRGHSPIQGGRDHTSHRLVSLGLSERQTLLVLMGISIISGIAAVILEAWSYSISLALLPAVVLSLALFSAYLGRMKIVEIPDSRRKQWNVLTNWVVDLTYRRRVLEVVLDFFLISFAYYLSFILRSGLPLNSEQTSWFLQTLPIVVGCSYITFFLFGVYRGVWEFLSMDDVLRYFGATLSGTVLTIVVVWFVFSFEYQLLSMFFIYETLVLVAILGTRFSFRFLDEYIMPRDRNKGVPILIYGAGDAGELALRECNQNPSLGYRPVGFIDDDPLKQGRSIHGVKVKGGIEQLEELIQADDIEGVIIASSEILESEAVVTTQHICEKYGIWVRRLEFGFVDLEQ